MDMKVRAAKIKLLLMDVDGVLTDGKIYIGNYGDEIKSFSINDGFGIMLLKKAGLKCAIITAKSSKVVKTRAKMLKIDKIYENHFKLKYLKEIMRRFRVREEEICFVGDDLIDIPIMKRIGLAVAVPEAMAETKESAHYITEKRGGAGAVREVCELILKSQGKWQDTTAKYFE